MKYSDYRERLSHNAEYQKATEELKYHFAFGNAVLAARLKKGWSQTELARRAGTKQANISRIEAGLGNPTLDLIKKICDTLDLELIFQGKYYYPPYSVISGKEIQQTAFRGTHETPRSAGLNDPLEPEKPG
jgi:transcriptional regulator with XRE-family HTH domain